jgi:cyclohexanone monooxygenase
MTMVQEQTAGTNAGSTNTYDAVIVGAGFSGLYMLLRLRDHLGLSVKVLEAGGDVGGTWYWNRYPGARCDVESIEYSYSFSEELQQEWTWSERYATQPEILRYANYVTDKFNLRKDIQFNTRVASTNYDEENNRWNIKTENGEEITAQFCIMALGCLSSAQIPQYPGLENFKGNWYHTGKWPHEGVDFTGQKVAVIGTGSSAIQSIPVIAQQASQLFIFQRTPSFSVPAWNKKLDPEYVADVKAHYDDLRKQARESGFGLLVPPGEKSALEVDEAERQKEFEARWNKGGLGFMASFSDLITSKEANDTAVKYLHNKIREKVQKPEVAEKLLPTTYPAATKRLCVDIGYYETYNRDNVTLIDLKATPIEEITAKGVRTKDGEYEVDSIVFATGFDAMTGSLLRIDMHGRGGITLQEKWAEGPRTYLGLSTTDFPNFFIITGPGSPSVISNMMVSIEQHVDWITGCIDYMLEHNLKVIEPSQEAETNWTNHVNEVANMTLFPLANSWYTGANIPGKTRIFTPYVGGIPLYRQTCDDVAAKGYEGFALAR